MRTSTLMILVTALSVAACGNSDAPVAPAPMANTGTAITLESTGVELSSVWGFAANDIFAAGQDGLMHFDGQRWTKTAGMACNLFRVWGTSSRDLWASDLSTVYRFDGNDWSDAGLSDNGIVLDIWGTSSTDVFVVGQSGGIDHFDGTTWTHMPTPVDEDLRAVWGTSSTDVFAVGNEATILHYNGSQWTQQFGPPNVDLRAVSGTSSDNVYAAGVGNNGEAVLLRYNGTVWQHITGPSNATRFYGEIHSIWATATGVYAVSQDGFLLYDGAQWSDYRGAATQINDIWGDANSEIHAVGETGYVARFDGAAWETLSLGQRMLPRRAWRASSDDVFMASRRSVYRWDGSDWVEQPGTSSPALNSIWGASPDNVVAVGSGNFGAPRALRFDGTSWSEEAVPTNGRLQAVWGIPNHFFAVSDMGEIVYHNGTQWELMRSPTTRPLEGLWGREPNEIFAVGEEGSILRYDGTEWEAFRSPTSAWLLDIAGVAADDIYAVGAGGTIIHYDGKEWAPMDSGVTTTLNTLWISRDQHVFAAGSGGTVLHLDDGEWSARTVGCGNGIGLITGDTHSDYRVFTHNGSAFRVTSQ